MTISLFKRGGLTLVATVMLLSLAACNQSPVRNPFAGRQEPKLGELPPLSQTAAAPIARVAWSNSILSKQQHFSKLIPYTHGDTVYAADHTGKIVALSGLDGKKIWTTNTGKKFTAGPTLMDNSLLLLATSDAKIVAVNSTNGQPVWEAKVTSEVQASPTGGKGVVLVHAIDGSVTALDGRNGESLWHVDETTPSLTLRTGSAPIITGETALVGFSSGKLLALNLRSGLIEWERVITLPRGRSELQRMVDISADPVVLGDKVYVITYQGKLAAVNVTSGNLEWEREISSYHNMAVDNAHIYVTDNASILWAIDRNTGATMWKQPALAERYITGPAVVNNMIVVADRGGYMHVISPQHGQLVSRVQLSGKFYQDPISMKGHQVVLNANNGKVASVQVSAQGKA